MFEQLRTNASSVYGKLGVAASVLGGVAAISRVFKVGLSGFFADLISYYRGLLWPLYELAKFLAFNIPELWVDTFVLWAGLVAIAWRLARPAAQIDAMIYAEYQKIEAEQAANPKQPTIVVFEKSDKPIAYDWLAGPDDFNRNISYGRVALKSLFLLPILALPFNLLVYNVFLKNSLLFMAAKRYNAVAIPAIEFAEVNEFRKHWRSGFWEAVAVPIGIVAFFALNAYI